MYFFPVHVQNSIPFIGSTLFDQSSILSLKQQEAGLITALKLRQHEQELINLTQRQSALLEQQEEQMQILLSRQLERQRRLEETLTEQKQRLGVYLEVKRMFYMTNNNSNVGNFQNLNV